jgi:UTP--glucose-1-phosphate uridylyltransferase
MNIKKAVIPAAGLGTRFLPATKALPKEMLPIVDKPAIQYIVEEAVASGIEDILIITGRGKRAIEDHFDKSFELEHTLASKGKFEVVEELENIANMVNIHYIRQKEPKGLGHAVWCARKFIGKEPFAVLLGDDIIYSEKPCLLQMINVYERLKCSVIGIEKVPYEDTSKYGIIKPDSNKDSNIYPILDLVEKPSPEKAPSNLAVIGRYILTPDIFDFLENLPPGAGGEIQLTDALRLLVKKQNMVGFAFTGKRYDTGNVQGYLQANIEYALRRDELKDELMRYLSSLITTKQHNSLVAK